MPTAQEKVVALMAEKSALMEKYYEASSEVELEGIRDALDALCKQLAEAETERIQEAMGCSSPTYCDGTEADCAYCNYRC
jgi:hypothetical protein